MKQPKLRILGFLATVTINPIDPVPATIRALARIEMDAIKRLAISRSDDVFRLAIGHH